MPDALIAVQILDRVSKTYAGCRTYRDSGSARTVYFQADGKWAEKKVFKTAFVRPERFRFEYQDDRELRYIVWRHGKDVRTWCDVRRGVEEVPSLALGLAGATGVSGGSAHTIPALLIPDEVEGHVITDLRSRGDA